MEKLLFMHALSKIDPFGLTLKTLKKEHNKLSVGFKCYNLEKNVFVIGFGKAVYRMALAVENILSDHIVEGILSVPHNINKPYQMQNINELNVIQAYQGALNNLPDQDSFASTQKIVNLCKTLPNKKNILLVLISGGGSALLCDPHPLLTLDLQLKIIKKLTSRGADIQELNIVRSCLSAVKGGKLPNLTPKTTQIISLIISDIVGDPLQYIASGPTVSPLYTNAQALEIFQKYELNSLIPEGILQNLDDGQENELLSKTIEERVNNVLIGSNLLALKGIEDEALAKGYYPVIISSQVCGEAKIFGQYLARLATKLLIKCEEIIVNNRDHGGSQYFDAQFFLEDDLDFVQVSDCMLKQLNDRIIDNLLKDKPTINGQTKNLILICGGETTVSLGPESMGMGGRSQEIALSFLNEISRIVLHRTGLKFLQHGWRTNSAWQAILDGNGLLNKIKNITLLSAGTDGQDGPTDAAGAIVFPEHDSLEYFANMYEITLPHLESHSSYSFFRDYEQGKFHLKTGLTGTNVMDIQLLTLKLSN